MANYNISDVDKMANNRDINHSLGLGEMEKIGDPEKFKAILELDKRSRNRPTYWGGLRSVENA